MGAAGTTSGGATTGVGRVAVRGVRIGSALGAAAVLLTASLLVPDAAVAAAGNSGVGAPIAGTVTAAPDSGSHRLYGGDYAFDVSGTADLYARFGAASGAVTLTVDAIEPACASGQFSDGGDLLRLLVRVEGTAVGTVSYAHLTDIAFPVGDPVPVGARIGRPATEADGLVPGSCWSAPGVHIESDNTSGYGCYVPDLQGRALGPDDYLGVIGSTFVDAANRSCVQLGEPPYAGLDLSIRPLHAKRATGALRQGGTVNQYVRVPGRSVGAVLRICNRNTKVGRVRVDGAGSNRRFRVRYRRPNGTDVTAHVVAGTFRTTWIARGDCVRLILRVRRLDAAVTGDLRRVLVRVSPGVRYTAPDWVRDVVHAGSPNG